MKTAIYDMGHGSKKKVYSPNTAPEEFFSDLIEIDYFSKKRQPKGYVFVNDHRKEDGLQYFGKPTELAQELAEAYPLGQGVVSCIEIIEWKDGNVLTILSTSAENHFKFDFWAGLEVKEDAA